MIGAKPLEFTLALYKKKYVLSVVDITWFLVPLLIMEEAVPSSFYS
jgi:hypothetical protein